MRVLITGIKGFTGRYVAAELEAAGWEVWGIGAHEEIGDPRYRRVDLADVRGLTEVVAEVRPDAVVHLAAIAFVAHDDAEAFYRVNLIGSRNLLAVLAAAEKRPHCVVVASSANVYGNGVEGVLDEACAVHPANDYAVSKLSMEYMARLWLDKLRVVIARPFNYTGVGQAKGFLLPKIVDHFQRRAPVIELGNLDVVRDFSDVRTVARKYLGLIETGQAGEVYNLCSGTGYALRDVLQMMQDIAGYGIEVRVNPAFVRSNEVRQLIGSGAKLDAIVRGVEGIPLADTLQWMYEADAV